MRVLVLTGGHRVDLDAFLGMVADICAERDWLWTHAIQPCAQAWLRPEHAGSFEALLCHDIPGLSLHRGSPPVPEGPDPQVARALVELLEMGQGLVVTHHSLAGWPGWEGWAEALGGRFHYASARLRGRMWPSSGSWVGEYSVRVAAPTHPVCAGVAEFTVTDELYCCPVFEADVVPLLRTDADLNGSRFRSAYEHVLLGERHAPDCSGHPPASDLLAWAKVAGRSPLVYLLPGDCARTFALANYRQLIANALAWVASSEAHAWARRNPVRLDPRVGQV
ncbi:MULTISPECIES: ThuA domain-containing protein [unclassified Frankia]|uniref:ThuA domain-containing protein n=1 Tax=unclassified Frankia TaxID=2632575 RepID=UPI002AD24B6C|nr:MULTISPECIES: ThuA domain-containing protein [unclassified Frankia]